MVDYREIERIKGQRMANNICNANVDYLLSAVAALREQLAQLRKPRMFPIQRSTPIRWELAQRAYDTYARLFDSTQSLERLAQRGGFGLQEFACLFAGHYPEKGHHECVEKADAVGRKITDLESRLAQVEKLTNFASHTDECEWWGAIPRTTCSCGLADILEKLP